ncbi:LamG-like jellyroll fold domain-containing protein [Patescibacteria group bacterium]
MKKTMIMLLALATIMCFTPFNVNALATQEIKDVNVRESVNSARIFWQTNKKTTTALRYGTNSQSDETLVISDYLRYDHSITLKALDAGTTYYYQIETDQGVNKSGSFETLGTKSELTVYQPYFTLLFDNAWENINGINPTKITDVDGLSFNEVGFVNSALKVNRQKSSLEYSCENVFNSGFGTVTAWVNFDRFDKSAVIWQTNDSRYAIYYEVGNNNSDFDKRIVARAGGNIDGEYPEAEYIIDPKGSALNKWYSGDWHFITMTWKGKFEGDIALFIDGRKVDESEYFDATGCSTFRVGNSYRDYDNMNFSIGKIDELKVHQWAMNNYYVTKNYEAYSSNSNFENWGQVAGAQIRSFKNGKLIKSPDNRIYVISRGKKVHINDLSALKRYGDNPVINVTWDEVYQYPEGGEFYTWSKFPDGTLLKGMNEATIYWVWDGEKRPIFNEDVFNRYEDEWIDVVEISQSELNTYITGFTYY